MEGPLQSGDDLRGLGDVLSVVAHGADRLGHVGHGVVRYLIRVWIVSRAPEPGPVATKAPVVDVDGGDPDLVTDQGLKVADHVAHARVSGDVHTLPLGIGQLGCHGRCQAEAQGRDIAPTHEATWDYRLVHRAHLVAGIARVVGDEGVASVDGLHQVAIDPIGVDWYVVGLYQRTVLGEKPLFGRSDLADEQVLFRDSAARLRGQVVDQDFQSELGIADDGMVHPVALVDILLIHRAMDDGFKPGIGDGVAEPARGDAGADGEEQVTLMQKGCHQLAAHTYRQRMGLREGALGLQRGEHGYLGQFDELQQLIGGIAIENPLARIQQRLLGRQEGLDRSLYIIGIRPPFPALDRCVGMFFLVVLADVSWQSDEDRPTPPTTKISEGSAHELGYTLRLVYVADPLGDSLETQADIVVAVAATAQRHTIGNAEHGRRVLKCLGKSAVGHLQACSVYATHYSTHANLLSCSDSREAVGECRCIPLIPHHQDGHTFLAQGVVHVTHWEGRHPGNPLRFEDPCKSLCC